MFINLCTGILGIYSTVSMDTTVEKRLIIIRLHLSGIKQSEIAKQVKIHQSTISRILKRYKTTGDSSKKHKTGSWRKMQLSIREMRRIRIESAKDPTATARKIRQLVGGKCLSLSIRTIQRYLMRVGRLVYRPGKSVWVGKSSQKFRFFKCRFFCWDLYLTSFQFKFTLCSAK